MKKWLKNFIEKIAKANNDNFKGKKLDCCDLNQKTNETSKKQN